MKSITENYTDSYQQISNDIQIIRCLKDKKGYTLFPDVQSTVTLLASGKGTGKTKYQDD